MRDAIDLTFVDRQRKRVNRRPMPPIEEERDPNPRVAYSLHAENGLPVDMAEWVIRTRAEEANRASIAYRHGWRQRGK